MRVEINDAVMSAVQLQPSDEIFRRGRDQFDRLYLDERGAACHGHHHPPYIDGVPPPDQVSGNALRLYPRPRQGRDVDRRRDLGLVLGPDGLSGGPTAIPDRMVWDRLPRRTQRVSEKRPEAKDRGTSRPRRAIFALEMDRAVLKFYASTDLISRRGGGR